MDIFTTSITNPGIKTNIISVLKRIHKNVADLSQYRPIARLSKGLITLATYQKLEIINRKSYPLMATVTITIFNIKTNILSAKYQQLTNVEAPLIYHPMERLSGKGLMLVVIYAKYRIQLHQIAKQSIVSNFSVY